MSGSGRPPFESSLGPLSDPVRERLNELSRNDFAGRLWRKDPSLWKKEEAHQRVAANRLGWLSSVGSMQSSTQELEAFSSEVKAAGLRSVVLLGMGGSSLCPEVFGTIFGKGEKGLDLTVLDTTDPASILAAEKGADPGHSLYLVSSKSGSTVETLSLYHHFRRRLESSGVSDPGSHFVAITDPGSSLERLAGEGGFRRCFRNPPDIGGRYSALSFFGLVPAALLGMDLNRLLERASRMAAMCGPGNLPSSNPGIGLGAILGEAARAGRDKLTLVLSEEIASFGYWLEQLVAESTGKEGRGILPVEGESPGRGDLYGQDRLMVYLRLAGGENRGTDAAAAAFREASHPLVRLDLEEIYDVGGEFLRWEIATATAGAILEVDPFDEPNVKESKDNTTRILDALEGSSDLPASDPILDEPPLAFHLGGDQEGSLRKVVEGKGWPAGKASLLAALLGSAGPGHYISLQAYIQRTGDHEEILSSIRSLLRDGLRLPATVGYGPRFLHSTGQYHKGGPPRGVFLQITAETSEDLPVPGRPWSFATLKAAQAQGDFEALAGRGLPAARIHIKGEIPRGLRALHRGLEDALVLVRRADG